MFSFGQTRELKDEDYNNSGAIELIFETEIFRARELAQQDIEKGLPFLLIQSGIAPTVYTTDSIFEKKSFPQFMMNYFIVLLEYIK